MIPVKHIDPDDLALYAMNLLPADESEEMALNLQHSVEARRLLAEIRSDLVLLALSADSHASAPSARTRLIEQVAREKKIAPAPIQPAALPVALPARTSNLAFAEEPATRTLAARTLPWLGWAIAATLLLEVGHLFQQREHLQHTVASSRAQVLDAESRAASARASAEVANTALTTFQDPTAVEVALTASGLKPPPQGRAFYVPSKGSLIFLASNLDPLKPNKTYELWLIPTTGQPIPAGTFSPDKGGYARIVMPPLPAGIAAKAFGVTIENAGGSPVPTSAILLHGAAS